MKDRVALVTGSSAGLGLAMAEALAREGCSLMLHGLEDPDAAEPQRAALAACHGVRVRYRRADLAMEGAATQLVQDTLHELGRVDVLVNNAVTRHFAGITEFPVEAWDRALAVNLSAAFHAIRGVVPGMRQRGWGRIVNMSSVYGARGTAQRIDYVTTKTALVGMTRAVAAETLGQGITCNALCPGAVLTPTSQARIEALMQQTGLDHEAATQRFLVGKNPTQRFVDAAHVGALLVFVCGDAAQDITGAVLPMEGGWLAL
ncbi:MAG: SDR family NAD(P)-dependent oxidoreductase [Rubrivivax sp.]